MNSQKRIIIEAILADFFYIIYLSYGGHTLLVFIEVRLLNKNILSFDIL